MLKRSWVLFVTGLIIAGISVGLAGCGSGSVSNEIKIGGNYEVTGSIASYAKSSTNGAKLAFKQANAAGGVLGKQINFVIADNKSEPSEAANAVTKLITQDKVVAIVGAIASSNTLAGSPIAHANKIPFVSPISTNPRVTFENGKLNDFAFRACFIDPFQGTVMASFATKSLKAKTAAIYIDNSSDYAKGLAQYFEESFVKSGGTIVAKEAYLQKDQDFRATLTKIKATNPDVIFLPAYIEEGGKIAKQARELGLNVPILGGDGLDSPKLVEIAGSPDVLNNVFFSTHYSIDDKDPAALKFAEAYKKEYGEDPDMQAALGYDAASLVIDAIKRANSAAPEKIKEALAQTKDFPAVSGLITFDAQHNPVKSAVVIEIKNGKQVFREKINP
ncbi:MAG: ABC transporter substrate-binding protein [Negativicutes bacterium]|nr:ABC transporter substrate-binding protein [Negativicutes bacterium]